MLAASSRVPSACRTIALYRMIFPSDVTCCSSFSLTSASYRLPDDCPLASRLCHMKAQSIAGYQHPPRLHALFQPHCTRCVHAAHRHAAIRRVIDKCKRVGYVGCEGYVEVFWTKNCRQDKCPLPAVLPLCPSSFLLFLLKYLMRNRVLKHKAMYYNECVASHIAGLPV